MLHVHLETPKHLTLSQRIKLQKELIKILAKKYRDNPTEVNKRDRVNYNK